MIYLFPEFSPGALAAFSGREFDAAHDQGRFFAALGEEPARCEIKQVHGDRILEANGPFQEEEADGLLTHIPRLALLIRTADCAPIFFFDAGSPAVGLCHAGWRGAQKRIVTKMVERFQARFHSNPSSLRAAIGPVICRNCYEVGGEFEDYFPGWIERRGKRRYFDLKGFLKKELKSSGIPETSIFDSGFCTACSEDRFFSARREGEKAGRLISVIMLK